MYRRLTWILHKARAAFRLGSAAVVAVALFQAASPVQAVETTSSTALEEAISARASGDLDHAVIVLKNLLQRSPRDLPARLELGDIYLQQGAPLAAEKELRMARDLGANDSRIRALMAVSYNLQAKFEDALKEIGGASPQADDTPDILLIRGQALAGLDRLEESLTAYRRAVDLAPNSPDAQTSLARALIIAGELDEAQERLDLLLARAPGHMEAWIARGELAQALGDLPAAVGAYTTALELAPDNIQLRLYRAATNLDMNALDDTLRDLDAVLGQVTYEPQALYMKSRVMALQGRQDEAQDAMQRAGDLLNNADKDVLASYPAMLRLAGVVNAALEQNIRAIDYLEKYLTRYPNDPVSLRWRAALALRQNQPAEAAPFLQRLLDRNPDDMAALNLMGIVQVRQQRFDLALPYFQKASTLVPEDAETLRSLTGSYLSLGDMDSAISVLSDAVRREPDNLASVVMLVLAHVQDRNVAAARSVWQTASAEWQETPLARQLSAGIHVAAGDFDNARKELKAALKDDPDFQPARLALARVELQTGRLEEAQALYREALSANEENMVAVEGLAQTALARRDLEEARRWYARAYEIAPNNGYMAKALMTVMIRQGRQDDAELTAKEFLRRHPGSLPVLSTYGDLLNVNQRPNETIALYRNAIATTTAAPGYYLGLAEAQSFSGASAAAIETFQRAVRMFPVSIPLHRAYIQTALRSGAREQAAQAADALISRLPENAEARALKGEVLLASRDYEEAYRFFSMVPDAKTDGSVVVGRFKAATQIGRGEEELQRLAGWVKAHPEDTGAKAVLAGAYQMYGNTQAAVREYEDLRPRLPQHAGLLNNLAWLYYVTGNDKALETAALAYELAPDSPNTIDTYGWILVKAGQAEKALPLLRRARSIDAASPIIQYHTGVALNDLGRPEEARRELEAALAADSTFEGHEHARTLLDEIAAAAQ